MMLLTPKAMFCEEDVAAVNEDLGVISSWLSSECLHINLSKVKFMIITRKRKAPSAVVCVEDHVV